MNDEPQSQGAPMEPPEEKKAGEETEPADATEVASEEPAAEAAATAPLNDEDAAAAQAHEAEIAMKEAAQAAVVEADTASEPIDPAKPLETDELDVRVADADVVNAEAAGEHDGATDSFTAMTTAGETVQIVKKMAVGTLTILITDQDQRYIAPADGGMDLEAYDPKKHGEGEEAA